MNAFLSEKNANVAKFVFKRLDNFFFKRLRDFKAFSKSLLFHLKNKCMMLYIKVCQLLNGPREVKYDFGTSCIGVTILVNAVWCHLLPWSRGSSILDHLSSRVVVL